MNISEYLFMSAFKLTFSNGIGFKGLKLFDPLTGIPYPVVDNLAIVTIFDGSNITTQNVLAQDWINNIPNVISVEFNTVNNIPIPSNFAFIPNDNGVIDIRAYIDDVQVFEILNRTIVGGSGNNFIIQSEATSSPTPEPSPAPQPSSSPFEQTPEEIAADKLEIEQITAKLRNNEYILDDESVLLTLGNSKMATIAMEIVDNGEGYQGLRTAGFTQSQALKVLSIYNLTQDTDKYLSEKNLDVLVNDPTKIVQLKAYLESLNPPLQLPSLLPYASSIRANHAVYTAIKNWSGV